MGAAWSMWIGAGGHCLFTSQKTKRLELQTRAFKRPGSDDLCLSPTPLIPKTVETFWGPGVQTWEPVGVASDINHTPFLISATRNLPQGSLRADTEWPNPAKRENKGAELHGCPEREAGPIPSCPHSILASLPISSWFPNMQHAPHILHLTSKQNGNKGTSLGRLKARCLFFLLEPW